MIDWWSLLLADFDLQEEHMIVMWCSILFVPFLLPHEIGILPALSVSWLRRSTIRLKSTGLFWLGLFWLGLNNRKLCFALMLLGPALNSEVIICVRGCV